MADLIPFFVPGYGWFTPAQGWELLTQGPCCFPFFPHGQAAACGEAFAASPKRGRGRETGRWV